VPALHFTLNQHTLILCLLSLAALHWIVRPIKPFTDAAQNDACGLTSYLAPETGSKGSRASVSATMMIRAEDLGSAAHRSHLMVIIASSDSLAAIALVTRTTGEIERGEFNADKAPKTSLQHRIGCGLAECYRCNVA
jgi:hypothetical protein